jgi:hypothetical protein
VAGCRHAFFNADGRCNTRNERFGIASHGPSVMNDETSNETIGTEEGRELLGRRLFLQAWVNGLLRQ